MKHGRWGMNPNTRVKKKAATSVKLAARCQFGALQLKHWRRGKAMYRELLALEASVTDAQHIAANSCRWWHNSRLALNRTMPIAYFDRLGMPRLSSP